MITLPRPPPEVSRQPSQLFEEPITPSNKTPQNSKPKGGEYDDLFASADAGKNYVAAVSTELVFTSKKKKDKPAKGLSEKELEDMEKLKQNIMTKKSELKAEGMSRAARPFSAERSCWLRRRERERGSACCAREIVKNVSRRRLLLTADT